MLCYSSLYKITNKITSNIHQLIALTSNSNASHNQSFNYCSYYTTKMLKYFNKSTPTYFFYKS